MTQEPSGGKWLGWARGRRRGSPRGKGQSQQGFWALEKWGQDGKQASSLLDQEKQGGERKNVSGFREFFKSCSRLFLSPGGFTEPPKQDP